MKKLAIRLSVAIGVMLLVVAIDLALLFSGRSLIIAPALRYVLHDLPFQGEEFSKEAWRAGISCEGLRDGECEAKMLTCPRGPMVADLIEQHFEIGSTQRDVFLPLLGKPDFERRSDDLLCLHQLLGYCSGMRIDYDSFFACFDEAQVLRRVGHMQH